MKESGKELIDRKDHYASNETWLGFRQNETQIRIERADREKILGLHRRVGAVTRLAVSMVDISSRTWVRFILGFQVIGLRGAMQAMPPTCLPFTSKAELKIQEHLQK